MSDRAHPGTDAEPSPAQGAGSLPDTGSVAPPVSSREPVAPRPTRDDSILVGEGVRKAFRIGDRTMEILHGVDIDLVPAESVALVGSSGAGKSTLLHILGLLDEPTEGSVRIAGRDCWSLDPTERSRLRNAEIGFVFQFYHLLPELDAVENVLLPSMIAHSTLGYRARRRELRERARATLSEFGLGERLGHRPGQLSGGERQRVAIARALFNDPSILIADEPTGNLDSGTGEKILELLFAEQERRGVAMLLVTHDERVAQRCGRTLYMEDGVIQADSTVEIPQ